MKTLIEKLKHACIDADYYNPCSRVIDDEQLANIILAHDPWMPIETAPKDGTEILLCRDGYVDYLDMIIGFWRTEGLATPGMYGAHNEGLLRPDVWRYWMPKPLPPKVDKLAQMTIDAQRRGEYDPPFNNPLIKDKS